MVMVLKKVNQQIEIIISGYIKLPDKNISLSTKDDYIQYFSYIT